MKTMKDCLAIVLAGAIVIATSPSAFAAPMPPPYQEAEQAPLSATDLDAIVSPIALYPDQLVAQILGAATYPDQVTAASNFVNSSGLKDAALMQAVDKQTWDPSVKALCAFPTVLDQMAKNLAWTSALGDASYNQQADVMAAIQRLRAQAKAAGNLKTTQEIKVVQESPQTIVIQPANPQVVYVPTYNPTVVYGTPYYPPGYSTAAMVTTGIISFGLGVAVGAMFSNNCCGWGWGYGGWGCGWGRGNVYYQNNIYVSRSNTFYGNNRYVNNPYYRNNNRPVPTPYGNNRYNNASNNKAAWSGNKNSGNRGSGNTVNKGGNTVNINGDVNVGNKGNNNRGGNTNAGNRTGNTNAANRPANTASRPAPSTRPSTTDRGYGKQQAAGNNKSAFGGYQQGGNARADANRGRQSMGASQSRAQTSRSSSGGARKR